SSSQNIGIYFTNVAKYMCTHIGRITPDGSFNKCKARESPDIFFKLRLQLRRKQILENGRAKSFVLENGGDNSAMELRGINSYEIAEIGSVNVFHLCRRYH